MKNVIEDQFSIDPYQHPHELQDRTPQRLDNEVIRDLSILSPKIALRDLCLEWVGIFAAVSLAILFPNPLIYIAAVVFIGARQHALTILGHDATHFRFLPNRQWNDWLANLFMQWPVFITVAGFRRYHGLHHKHLNKEKDGNRALWKTHNSDGELNEEWVYPKSPKQLALTLLRRGLFLTGIRWIARGLLASFFVRDTLPSMLARTAYYVGFAVLFTVTESWLAFLLLWIVPLCTWHVVIQYARLISEHSAVGDCEDPFFNQTRTTIPTFWESLLMLPRNIGYHFEHHWYPSVPYYNLPKLHAALKKEERIAAHWVVSHSILSSLKDVTAPNKGAPACVK